VELQFEEGLGGVRIPPLAKEGWFVQATNNRKFERTAPSFAKEGSLA